MKTIFIMFIFSIAFFSNAQNSIDKKLANKLSSKNKVLFEKNELISCEIQNINLIIPTIEKNNKLISKKEELTRLWETYDNNLIKILRNNLEFAQQNPQYEYSLNLISGWVSSQAAMGLYDEYDKAFKLFSREIQNSKKGKKLKQELEKFKLSKVGSIAPLFSLKNLKGDLIKLKEFQNKKYVLIDFWASWCKPCREDNPYLVNFYKDFKNKGLEIISISRDKNLESWKKTILKDNMNWINISIVENQSEIEKEYFVYGIPHKVLIDKNGIIVGKWKGSGMKNINSINQKLTELINQ